MATNVLAIVRICRLYINNYREVSPTYSELTVTDDSVAVADTSRTPKCWQYFYSCRPYFRSYFEKILCSADAKRSDARSRTIGSTDLGSAFGLDFEVEG